MFEETKGKLGKLQGVLLTSAGKPFEARSVKGIIAVSSWTEVVWATNDENWLEAHRQESNKILDAAVKKLQAHQPDRVRSITKLYEATEPLILSVIAPARELIRQADSTLSENQLKLLEERLGYDLAQIARACEYSDLIASPFYRKLYYWYLEGRVPCGMKRQFLRKKLLIF